MKFALYERLGIVNKCLSKQYEAVRDVFEDRDNGHELVNIKFLTNHALPHTELFDSTKSEAQLYSFHRGRHMSY